LKTWLNHYHLTSEQAITASAQPKKEPGMYEIYALDHLASKVDALVQKFDKLNVSVVSPSYVVPACEICEIVGHTGVEFQLGVSVVGLE